MTTNNNIKFPVINYDENHNPIIEGDFEFTIGEIEYDSITFMPKRKISFFWTPEMKQDMIASYNSHIDYNELWGEKIKNDFIKLLKTNNEKQ